METVFLDMFLFGGIFTLVMALFGGGHGHFINLPGHKLDFFLPPGMVGPLPYLLSSSAMLAFVTCFGAAGYAALHFAVWPLALALGAALPAGLAGGGAVASTLAFLRRGETELLPEPLEGKLARVTVTIPAGRVGEIVLELSSGIRSEAARALENAPIPRGTEVVVIDVQGGVVLVQPLKALEAGAEGG